MKNDLEMEKMVRSTLSFGDLGQCNECKGAFLPDDKVVCVVRNVKPRHYECWDKMGKPHRKPWGMEYTNPDYAVHIRKAAELEYKGCLYKNYDLQYIAPYDSTEYNVTINIYAMAGDTSEPIKAVTTLEATLAEENNELIELPLIRDTLVPDFHVRVAKAFELRKKLIDDSEKLRKRYGNGNDD